MQPLPELEMTSRIAVITGANKGIGLEIAKKLARAGLKTIMTARNEELGRAAAREVSALGDIEFRQLDISRPESVSAFVVGLERDYGKCDILINNAGFAFKGADPTPAEQQARPTFATNYFGTMDLTIQMLPLLRKGSSPRIINVASQAGHLKIMKSQAIADRLVADDLTLDELNDMANLYIAEVEAGTAEANGWPSTKYGCSKLLLIGATRVLARQERASGVTINACCPGYCATDMSSHRGTKTAEQGAMTPVMLALLEASPGDRELPTGKFFAEEVEVQW